MHRQNKMNDLQDVLGPNMSSFQLVDDQLAGVFAQSMPAKTYHLSGLMSQAHVRALPHKAMSFLASMPDCLSHAFDQPLFNGLPSRVSLKFLQDMPSNPLSTSHQILLQMSVLKHSHALKQAGVDAAWTTASFMCCVYAILCFTIHAT